MAYVLSLDFYKIVFFIELFVAESMFIFRMKKRSLFPLRYILAIVFGVAIAYFIKVFYYNAIFSSLIFFILFCVSVILLAFCFNTKIINVIFCSIAGYSTQHLSYQFVNLVLVASGLLSEPMGVYGNAMPENATLIYVPISIVCYFITYWLIFLVSQKSIKEWKDFNIKNTNLLVLAGIILAVDIIVNAFITYQSNEVWNKTFVISTSISGIICCVLTLWVQFNLLLQKDLKHELADIYHLYRQEQKQLITSQTNIDLINQKCHDLKYQIRAIAQNNSLGESTIKEIENCISIYDSVIKTGNKTLDTILTEKSLLCHKNNITFTCVADGARLDFINEVDLFTLFGNAFDNAIEAVLQLDESRRVISLTTKSNEDFFSICLRNYYKGELEFKNAVPKTTKKDVNFHGFGVKSIQGIVEKYGGDMYISAQENVFNLNILFILDKTKKIKK